MSRVCPHPIPIGRPEAAAARPGPASDPSHHPPNAGRAPPVLSSQAGGGMRRRGSM